MSDFSATFRIVRDHMDDRPTPGNLYAGDLELASLEDPWKDNEKGVSCIPVGTYPVVIDYSVRFARPMPHILEVPGRTGIRVHAGNTDVDTEGCPLVGIVASADGKTIFRSREAFAEFYEWLTVALKRGTVGVEISVVGEPQDRRMAPKLLAGLGRLPLPR